MAALFGPMHNCRRRPSQRRRTRLGSSSTWSAEHLAFRFRHEELEPRWLLACNAPQNPVLCLDTEQGVTFDSGTGEVSQWSDQSGQGNDLFASGVQRPVIGSLATPSGLDAISFDGNSQRLIRTLTDVGGINGLPTGNLGRSTFLVARFHNATALGGAAFGTGMANQAFGMGVSGTSPNEGQIALQGWGAGNDLITGEFGFNPGNITDGWMLLSVVHEDDGADPADNVLVYRGGVQIATWNHQFATVLDDFGDLNGNTASRLVLGEEIAEAGQVEFDIGAWLVYDQALNENDRQAVETHLQDRFLNQRPNAANDGQIIDAGDTVVIDILANDSDPDGTLDPTSIQIIDAPSQATSSSVDLVTGQVTYTHNGSTELDSFSYTVADNLGAVSLVTDVTVAIHGQPLSLADFSDEVVINSGLSQPLSMAFFADGRQLILEKTGKVWIADPNSGGLSEYMTITNISAGGERGLLDITLAPDFDPAAPGDDYFYLYYTPASPELARVARFTHLENMGGLTSTGDLTSEFEVWNDTDGYLTCCHYGGGLDFGPDGKLWLTASDKFTAPNPGEFGPETNHPQDLTKAGGKVLRMNPDGTVPDGSDSWPANPYLDPIDDDPTLPGDQDYYDYIWAYGLRNPFRARWDFPSGRFFIAEVGGNQQDISYEDLHIATLDNAGVDFGWNNCEGPGVSVYDACSPTHELPIFYYPHNGLGASITGGEVYRGAQFPQEWQGVYFYGDFTRSFLRYLTIDDAGVVTGDHPFKPSVEIPGDPSQVVFNGVGSDGALYYILLGGEIRRIVQPNHIQSPAIMTAEADVVDGNAPLAVNFSAQVSDPNGDPLTYTWYFGDGSTATGSVVGGQADVGYTYTTEGLYSAHLEISDGQFQTFSQLISILVGSNQAPVINQVAATPLFGDPPLLVTFAADVSDPDNDPLTYQIDFGDGRSVGPLPVPGNGQISEAYTYDYFGSFNATLIVSDGTLDTQSDQMSIVVGPTSIPPVTNDLVLLLESDIKVTLSTGSTVSSWVDGSGWGNSLSSFGDPQVVPGSTPGGLPAIVFDGNGDKLQRLASATINQFPTDADDRTVFAVIKYVDAQLVSAGISFGKGAPNEAFGLATESSSGELMVQGFGSGNDFPSGVNGQGAGWMTQSVVLSSDTIQHYQDGTLIDTDSHAFSTNLADASAGGSRIVIGEQIDELGFSQLEVAAVIVYNRALTDTERQQVEEYLDFKYFVGNLPPLANNDAGLVANSGNVVIDLLANDSDSDGVLDPSSVQVASPPAHGTLSIDSVTGAITYEHDGSPTTSDLFTYRVQDELGATSNAATVTITIGGGTLVTAGLVAALESDAGIATTGGTNIAGWLDSSGRGNDLQAVVGDPQLASQATPSGQDAIRFDGDDSLARIHSTDPLNGLPIGAADRSMFIVSRYDVTPHAAGVTYGNGTANEAFGLGTDGVGGQLAVLGGDAGSSFVSGETGTADGWLVQSVVLSSGGFRHFRDGRLIDTDINTFNTTLDRLVLAEEIAGLGFVEMDVAAVLLYDRAVDETERQNVEAYLFDKYLTNMPPQFTSPADIIVPENATPVVTLTATDPNPDVVSFSISAGLDMSLFQIVGPSNDELAFIAPPDFDNPDDANLDNIYELQVAAFDGINTTTMDMTVRVVDPPFVLLDPVAAIDEGGSVTLDGAMTLQGALGSLTLDLSWGDPLSPDDMQSFLLGTTPLTKAVDGIDWEPASQTFSINHPYLDDNPSGDGSNTYVIDVTLTDDMDVGTTDTSVTVNNVAPTATIGGAAGPVDEGSPVTLDSTVVDPGSLDTHTFDWQVLKDGAPYAVGALATLDFTPDDDGTYTVILSVTDDDGGVGSDSVTITVNNVLPTLDLVGDDDIDEGGSYPLNVENLFDPGDDTATTIAISWGDTTPLATFAPQDLPQSLVHQYVDGPASYLIIATVIDEEGVHEAQTKSILVNNLAPTAQLLNGGPVVEGSNGIVQFVNPNDPSMIDVTAGFLYSYDFDNDGSFEIVDATSEFATVPGVFLDDPQTTIRARIEDKDGGFTDLTTSIPVSNVAPVVNAGADATAFADELFTQQITFTDPGNDAPWEVRIDWDGDAIFDETLQSNDREFDVSHTYDALAIGTTFTVTVEVDDQDGGVHSDTIGVTVRENTLRVVDFVQHASGIDVQFNRPLDTTILNLYDGDDPANDLPDVSLVGGTVGTVTGSLVWDPSNNTLSFVRTGDVLADDTYTLTLTSALDAFRDLTGDLLDGDSDFAPGGDFVTTFDVTQGLARVVGMGDFARGADQVVDLTPADLNDIALPIVIDNAEDVMAVDLHIVYDPTLLTISGVTLADGLPADWTATVNNTVLGRVQLTASGTTALTGTNVAIFAVDAIVPSAAPYGESQAIRIENLRLNEDVISSVADVSVHHAVYLSDASGNGQFTALDASYIARVVVALDTGFDAHQRIDPVIVADATGDGTLSGLDSSLVAQASIGLPSPEIPDDPDPMSSFKQNTGPVRFVSIESGTFVGNPGTSVTVPVEIDDAESLLGANLVVGFDGAQLSLTDALIQNAAGQFMDGWTLVENMDELAGVVRIAMFATAPHIAGSGSLLSLDFDVKLTAPAGTTMLDVEGELNEGLFEIVAVDGDFTVPGGDFNQDGQFNCDDIDALTAEIAGGGNDPLFDLTGDAIVDLLDRDAWLAIAATENGFSAPYLLGDANLDGFVDGIDFIIWNENKFTSAAAWCKGDFSADGFVDGLDFILWNNHKFQSSGTPPATVSPDATDPQTTLTSPLAHRLVPEEPVDASPDDPLTRPRAYRAARVDQVFATTRLDKTSVRNVDSLAGGSIFRHYNKATVLEQFKHWFEPDRAGKQSE
jgi:glucose/arabinose dehydrogenase